MTTPVDVALQISLAVGEDPPTPLNLTGKRVYFGRKKKSWYRLHELRTDGGTYVVVGAFGNYKHGLRFKVDVDWKGIGEEERARLQALRATKAAEQQAERERELALAAMSAAELWRAASREGRSAYLQRKHVETEGCRFLPDGSIVIPLLRYDRPREEALVGTQRIFANGKKLFTAGFGKKGAALRLGPQPRPNGLLLVCEGYATGLTLRQAVQQAYPVVVALDAGNLQPVCDIFRAKHPELRLLVCADDDWRTTNAQGEPYNAGLIAAKAVCKATEACDYVRPVFPPQRGEKDTDFNDLHVLAGLRRVQGQLMAVVDAMRREARVVSV